MAIVPVVLFHLGVRPFSGGFVGVDVFFVISGYLITRLIHAEMSGGSFSFTNFYERRIRRLFPALIAMTAVTALVGAFIMLPEDLERFSRGIAATSIFGVNFLAWTEAGYFAATPEVKPLLHAWSLSVEEQFYLTYPIALLLVMRLFRRSVFLPLAAAALVSLAASVVWMEVDRTAVFYLPIFRAWELLLGALLALEVLPRVSSARARDALSLLGLVLIAYSVVAFSAATAFPGANALYPVVGAALLIYAGIDGRSLVGRVLALPPIVFVGLISYSLYLWHWPLIVFVRYWLIREPTSIEKIALALGSVVLAVVSWRYVERPFRGAKGTWSRAAVFKAAAISTALLVAIGVVGMVGRGLPGRLPADVVKLAAAGAARTFNDESCYNPHPGAPLTGCRVGAEGTPSFLLWGDSHSLVLAHGIDVVARRAGATGLFIGNSGCPSLVGVERYDPPERGCRELGDRVLTLLEENPRVRTVLLASRWSLNSTGRRYPGEGGGPAVISPNGVRDNPAVFREGLARTLSHFAERNIAVVFVAQAPEVGWTVPSVLARSRLFGRRAPPAPTPAAHRERQSSVTAALEEASRNYTFRVLDPSTLLCSSASCAVERDGIPLYEDGHHLNVHGSMLVAPLFDAVFAGK